MGWVKKGKNYYFYRSELENGKVSTTYWGKYPECVDIWNGTIPKVFEPRCIFTKDFLIKVEHIIRATKIVYHYCLLLTGHHLDCNGKWRKARKSLLFNGRIPINKKKNYPRVDSLNWFIENSESLVKGLKEQLSLTTKETIKIIEQNYPGEIKSLVKENAVFSPNAEHILLDKGKERKTCELDQLLINALNLSTLTAFHISFDLNFRLIPLKNKIKKLTPYCNCSLHNKLLRNKISYWGKLSSRDERLLEPIETIIKKGYEKIKDFEFSPSLDELVKKILRRNKRFNGSIETIIDSLENKRKYNNTSTN